MSTAIDEMIGKKYGRLTVLGLTTVKAGRVKVMNLTRIVCACDCGIEVVADPSAVRLGKTVSCGCFQKEQTRARATHGDSRRNGRTAEYRCWIDMKSRCRNKNNEFYKFYGGRGISVSQQWVDDFESFLSHVGRKPSPKHTIDRIDNDGNYEPGNVRWATRREQVFNRRNTILVDLNGDKTTVKDACRILGLNYRMVKARLERGWSADKALTPALWHRQRKP